MGYQCALNIAKDHPNYLVVIASRTDPNSAADTINQTTKQSNVQYRQLDLADLNNVRQFAQSWKETINLPIQALVFNAGLQMGPTSIRYSKDGVELTFAVNHVGHALLFYLLSPQLAADARIVVVSSGTHDPLQKTGMPDANYTSAELLAHPNEEGKKIPGEQRYSTSKLVNVLWTYALARRIESSTQFKSRTVVAFDPGLMPGTGLAREFSPVVKWIWLKVMPKIIPLLKILMRFDNIHTPAESGATLAWLAVGDESKKSNGVYYEGRKQIKSSSASYDVEKQEDLWKWTVDFISQSEEEKSAWATLP